MSIVIRLSRLGRTNRSHFRVAVFPKRSRRDGPAIEQLGIYDPRATDPAQKTRLSTDRILYWYGLGAEVTPRVRLWLNRAGVALKPRKSNKPNNRMRKSAARKKAAGAKGSSKK
ncbi:MAG: 30S ribosomal protein S16 [Planctomycetia bacterium]